MPSPDRVAPARDRVAPELNASNRPPADQVRQRTAMIEMLHDVASCVYAAASLEEAVVCVLRRVAESNGWSYGHAYVVAPDVPDRLLPMRAHYEVCGGPFAEFHRQAGHLTLTRGEGLPGRALESGEPVWAEHLPEELRPGRPAVLAALPIVAAAAFPVAVEDRVELVLEFFGTHPIEDEPQIREGMASVSVHLARTIQRLRSESDLRESEQRFRELAESISQVFWVFDPSANRMLYVSPGWAKIVGAAGAEAGSDAAPWRCCIHPHDRQRVNDELSPGELTERVDVTYRVVRTDGEVRWVHDTAVPLHDEAGRVRRVLGVAEDVTERRELEREIADAATHEQQRLSRDLHDSIGQELTGLTMMAAKLARSLQEHAPGDAGAAGGLVEGLKRTLQQVRRISRGLAPVDIESGGLTVALAQLAEQTRLMATTECIFRCENPVMLRDPGVANHLYRIAQEAITNALRHAQARTITITLDADGEVCRLMVEDDGRGIDAVRNGSREGTGLRIMRYRANLIGAQFDIGCPVAGGTRIGCRIRLDGQLNRSG